MKALLTGASGFIGSHLLEALTLGGHEVCCAGRQRLSDQSLPAGMVTQVDLEELLSGRFKLSGFDAVLHLAAVRHRWGASESDYLQSNVDLTRRLLERTAGSVKHFIYCSSIAVFGWPGRGPIDENFPYQPIDAYGRSKVACEHLMHEWAGRGSLQITILRPSITYGRRDPTGMLTKLVRMIDRGVYATVGSGNNRVQLAHVADIVQGFLRAMGNPAAFGHDYIITARHPIRINSLVDLVSKTLGKEPPRLKIPHPLAVCVARLLEFCYRCGWHVTGREPMIAREKIRVMTTDRCYSITRAEQEIGYRPAFDYREGIADFIRDLREEGTLKTA